MWTSEFPNTNAKSTNDALTLHTNSGSTCRFVCCEHLARCWQHGWFYYAPGELLYVVRLVFVNTHTHTHTHTHTIQWQCNRWLSWQSSIQVYQWARCWFSAMKTPRSPCSTSLNSPRISNRGNSFQKYRLSRVLSLSLSLSRALNNIYTSSWIFLILTLETLEMWRHLKCGARKVSSKAWIIKV